ncbi:MAG TPA: Gfo/Idh/MocA family oxidoreductase [Thermoleophilia bacterium]|nr:Gfo/Idh/MocA family oxidoreductase [Thermoleophilia bacterium]
MTNVAIVGYGYWGPNLLRNYLEVPGVSVTWVCDRRPEALEKVRRRYPAQAVSGSYDEVLADPAVDAVVIATPISTHFDLAAAALRAGKHVFVEKPMTSSTTDAEELVRLAGETGLTLMVGHTFVFSPPVRKLGELIHDGSLGDIHFITSSRVNLGLHQKDVSVVWDLATHDLSILYYWLGESASSVYVTGRGCIVPEIPDVAFVNLRFPSGVVANVDIAWLSPVKLRRTVVVGSRRMALYDDTESVEKVKIFDHGVDYKEPESFGEFHLSYRTGDIVAPRLDTVEPLFAEASHFIECVTTGRRPITDGRAGLQVVASLEAAERSLRDHGGVQAIAAAHGPGV